jgi:hypothetical protein
VSEPVVPTLTPAVRDLPEWEPNSLLYGLEMKKREDFSVVPIEYAITPKVDPLLLKQEEEAFSRVLDRFSTLIYDFAGQSSTSSPPDATGDVGRDHFVQAVNQSISTVRVLDKATGANLRTFTMQSLASSSPCSSGFCDPVVVYDQVADRWIISELPSSGGNVCVYVSTSPDPTGTWYAYAFPVEASLPDYPKYGLWPQNGNGGSYLMGANAGASGLRDLFAFDRAKMLAGLPATFQKFSVPRMPNLGFQLVLPSSLEGSVPPPDGEPAIFMRHRDDEALQGASTPGFDFLDMWTLSVDWSTPANSLLTQLPSVEITDYDLTLCGIGSNWACMPQPGTAQKLDPVREALHFPLQYRNFGDHQALVGTFPTDVDGTDHAALRWFEMRKVGAGPWAMHQEGVIGGEAGVHRSIGSIAMDQSGNMAVGYTRTGTTAPYYPSIYYKGRLSSDPPGTMPQGEYVIVDATTSKTNNERWGDYAGMAVDPVDDCTFWFTTEYGGSGSTRVSAFKFDACGCLAIPGAPAATASVPQDNRIELTWDDSATDTITEYLVLRSTTPGGPYSQIAAVPDASPGVPGGPSYTLHDDGVSGGTTYYYVVRSTDGAACTSPASPEVSALATGQCTLAPAFGGLAAVTNPGNTTCTLQLSWAAAASACTGAVSYNVYRDTSASFVPAEGNRIAAGVSGTAYSDSVELTGFTRYYYVVRAVDGASAMEESNSVRRNAIPTGTLSTTSLADTFEGAQSGGGFDLPGWAHNSIAGTTNWAWSTARFFDGSHSWFAQDVAGVNDKVLVSPPFGVGPATVLSFRHTYQFEGSLTSCYDGGTLEVSTDGGTVWTVVPAADFAGGAYTGTVNAAFSNPIGGKPGWCSGTLGTLNLVTVNLGADANLVNQEVRVRWHEGDDTIVSSSGWYVDSVAVTDAQTAGACTTAFACLGVHGCSGHGACVAHDTCACDAGWTGPDCSAAVVASAGHVAGLQVDKAGAGVTLTWGGSCIGTDSDYAVYEGAIGDFTARVSRLCSTEGGTTATLAPLEDNAYWLIVPRNGTVEGSYGQDSTGAERPPAAGACLPPSVGTCP